MSRFLTALFILFALAPPCLGQTTAQFRGAELHTGLYSDQHAYSSVSLKWSFKAGNAIRCTPLILGNKIFTGSADNHLYALDTSGNVLWKFRADAAIHSSPAVFKNTIIFSSRANTVFAVDAASGIQVWKQNLGKDLAYEWSFDYYISSPLVSGAVVYTGSGDGNL